MKAFFIFFSICFVILASNALTKSHNTISESKSHDFKDKLRIMEERIKGAVDYLLQKIPMMMQNTSYINISTKCMKETLILTNGIRRLSPWAFKFLDASAKIIDGVLTGSFTSFGAYDECLDIAVPSKMYSRNLFRGKYCSIDFIPSLPSENDLKSIDGYLKNRSKSYSMYRPLLKAIKSAKSLQIFPRLGICVPSGCSRQDVDRAVKILTENFLVTIQETRCEVKEANTFSASQIFIISCFAFIGFLSLTASIFDAYARYKEFSVVSKMGRALLAFSIIANASNIFTTKDDGTELRCVYGIRFITMTWIICAHSYGLVNIRAAAGPLRYFELAKRFDFQPIVNSTVSVDTFFLLSGFLESYNIIKGVKYKNHSFSIFSKILRRLFRLLPSYACLVMFSYLLKLIGSGPTWHDFLNSEDTFRSNCGSFWWRKLLFVSNYFPFNETCLQHTWYLDVDFQLHLLGLTVLLVFVRWPKFGIILSLAGIMMSVIGLGIVTYIYRLIPNVTFDEAFFGLSRYYYMTPLSHMGAHFVGILVGYLFATKSNLALSVKIQLIGWILAFICNFSLLYGNINWQGGTSPSLLELVIYGGLFRTLWALGVAWVILCCVTGHGGIVNRFLSWKYFIPLGKLTFLAYLVHPLVAGLYQANFRTSLMLSNITVVWLFFAYIVLSYMIAFVGSSLIEIPFILLGRILLQPGQLTSQDKPVKDFGINEVTPVNEKERHVASENSEIAVTE